MRKNFGAKAILYPMPVLIIGTYDENGKKLSQTTTWSDGTYSECKYENGVIAWDKYLFADGSSCEITYQDDVRVYQVGIDADGNRYEIEYYEDGATCKKEIRYYTDGTKIIEERYENNNWKYTWDKLPKYDNNNKAYTYTAEETLTTTEKIINGGKENNYFRWYPKKK